MKILLILPQDNIYRYHGFANMVVGPYAPLTLVTLAALVPKDLDAQIDLFDEGIRKPNYEKMADYDVVGITCVVSSANRAYEIAAYWRGRGSFVVLGGAHPTLNPDEAARHADSVVVGLAEETWPQLLWDFKNSIPQKRYHTRYSGELSSPAPRRDLFPRFGYLPVPTVIANRGCNHHCNYCVVNQADYARCVTRPVSEIIDEIRGLKSRRIMLLDPNLASDREYAKALFHALIPLKLKWMAPASSEIVDDPEIFDLMVSSGCDGVMIGFESFSQASLDRIGKKFNQVNRYKEIVKTLHARGVAVSGCFVLGFDDETPEDLERTADIVYDIGVDFPRYAILTPFPGTRLFDRVKKEGRLLTEDWSFYDSQHVVFQPKHLSPRHLQELFDDTIRKSFSYRHIFHRARGAPHSLLLSLMANLGLREALFSAWRQNPEPGRSLPIMDMEEA